MPMIETEVLIARSSTDVFVFATNAARWPQWHPATAGVDDVPDRPLVEGETVLEHIRAVGRTFDARWRRRVRTGRALGNCHRHADGCGAHYVSACRR